MNFLTLFVYLLAGLVMGAAFIWLGLRSRATALAQRKSELEQEVSNARLHLQQVQADLRGRVARGLVALARFAGTVDRRFGDTRARVDEDVVDVGAAELRGQAARQRQSTAAFTVLYGKRAGMEGTLSQGVQVCDLRQARYRTLSKVRLEHVATATALSLQRLDDWWTETPRATTRTSPG